MTETVIDESFIEARKRDVKKRVSKKRFKHILGVSDTACALAKVYGQDTIKASLAGVLHDWDKGYDDAGIRERVVELGLDDRLDSWIVEHMPQVLHGPTAACALGMEFPEIPQDVLEAIRKHTTADYEMSDLDKIIYISDAIEPSRTFDVVQELRDLVGTVSLDELYYRVYKFWTEALVAHDVVLYPETIAIWNDLATKRKKLVHG